MEVKRSRFITALSRAQNRDAATGFINSIRQSNSDASHNCWAFIVGNPNKTSQMGSSDDGEPSGTAGKPMLNVLIHNRIGDVAVVVTRYFGGTRLGTGGLVRAYSGCVLQAIEEVALSPFIETKRIEIVISYADEPHIRQLIESTHLTITNVQYGEQIQIILDVPKNMLGSLSKNIADITRGRTKIEPVNKDLK